MSRFIAICDGELIADSAGFECTGEWISVDAGGIPGAFDISQLDPVILSEYFAIGFICSCIPSFAALAISKLTKSIKEF